MHTARQWYNEIQIHVKLAYNFSCEHLGEKKQNIKFDLFPKLSTYASQTYVLIGMDPGWWHGELAAHPGIQVWLNIDSVCHKDRSVNIMTSLTRQIAQ